MAVEIDKDIHPLDEEGARELFERSVQSLLGITTDEFLRNLQDGAYNEEDAPDVSDIIALLPMIQKHCQNKVS
ncbi:hypothetical protein GC174_03350 [bacterium]|nr:hypothetical protein [bacterium]